MRPRNFFQQAIIFEGGMAVVALIFSFLLGLNLWYGAILDWNTAGWIIVATLPLIVFYFIFKVLPFKSLIEIDRLVHELFREYMYGFAIWQFVAIATVAGIGEELLFRGLLQSGLLSWIGNGFYQTVVVILGVSVLFGVGHAVTKMYFILAIAISIYFGILLLLTENILVPIAVHALYDLFVFLYIRFTVYQPQT